MDRAHGLVRFGGKEPVEIGRHLALLHLPHARPFGPDACEEGEWTILVSREPDRGAALVLLHPIFREAGERHEAAMLDPEPTPPMRRAEVADIGNAGIGLAVLEGERRRRHPPPHHDELAAVAALADHRGGLVGEDGGQRGEVAGQILHNLRDLADRGLALGQRIQVADGSGLLSSGVHLAIPVTDALHRHAARAEPSRQDGDRLAFPQPGHDLVPPLGIERRRPTDALALCPRPVHARRRPLDDQFALELRHHVQDMRHHPKRGASQVGGRA